MNNNIKGIIIKGVAGSYTVSTELGDIICSPRGIFRNKNVTPLVGDSVIIDITTENTGILHTLNPRKNQLNRPLVANVDQAIITMSTLQPAFNLGLLDRFLVLAAYNKIPAIICINKLDLSATDDFMIYLDAGYTVIYTSTINNTGLDELRKVMAGKLNVFAGPSGVGKSSLINALSPKLDLETGGLSVKLGRGKHTTRHSEIFSLGLGSKDGYCIDTSGFTSLDTGIIPKEDLDKLFKEFEPFLGTCQFSNCLHDKEKRCAIKDEVGNKIHPLRYDSYLKIKGDAGYGK